MDESSQRNWFPVIVVGLTFCLAFAFYAKFHGEDVSSWFRARPTETERVVVPTVTEDEYKAAVMSIFATFDVAPNPPSAKKAYDSLILLHVPATMQQFHIDCVIALGKLAAGGPQNLDDAADARERFDAMHLQYPWFTL